jgi:hypothetical protein
MSTLTDKKFWEQCGIEGEEERYTRGRLAGERTGRILYPPIDLNNLFKYAVPKLIERNLEVSLHRFIDEDEWSASLWSSDESDVDISISDKDPAQALKEAISKALGGYVLIAQPSKALSKHFQAMIHLGWNTAFSLINEKVEEIKNPYCGDVNSPDYQDFDIYGNAAFERAVQAVKEVLK